MNVQSNLEFVELKPGDLVILTQTVNGLRPGDIVQRGTVLTAKTRSRKTGLWLCEFFNACYWISDQFLTKYTEGGPPQMSVSVSMPHGKLPSEQVSVDRRQYDALCQFAFQVIKDVWGGAHYDGNLIQNEMLALGLIKHDPANEGCFIIAGDWYQAPGWYEPQEV